MAIRLRSRQTDRDRAEQVLDTHEHRIAALQADLERLNDQLEETRQALRETRKQLPRLHRASTGPPHAAIRQRRDAEQRLNALEH